MQPSPAQKSLEAGEWLTGMFQPEGADFETAGILRWTSDNGAELRLVDLSHPWPREFNAELTIHGALNAGAQVTLMESTLRHLTGINQAERFGSWLLAVGAHTSADETWEHARYCPTSLHEWYPERGFAHKPEDEHGPHRVELQRVEPKRLVVPGAEIFLQLNGQWNVNYEATWSIENAVDFVVRPAEPLTIESYWRQFRSPLLGFVQFASDRPDDLRWEAFGNPETKRRIVVLRNARQSYERKWRQSPGHFLFRAADIADEAETIGRWLEVWRESEPSLGLFCETIQHGDTYSPSRYLTLYTAAEGYWKGTKRIREQAWNIDALVKRANIDETVSKADRRARQPIGALRKYHAHLGLPGNLTGEAIALSTFDSTRRLHLLIQACLLRELGLETEQIESLISRHYMNWPIP